MHPNVTWFATPHRDYVNTRLNARRVAVRNRINQFRCSEGRRDEIPIGSKHTAISCVASFTRASACNNYYEGNMWISRLHTCLVVCWCVSFYSCASLDGCVRPVCENSHCIWQRFACLVGHKQWASRSCFVIWLLFIIEYSGLCLLGFSPSVFRLPTWLPFARKSHPISMHLMHRSHIGKFTSVSVHLQWQRTGARETSELSSKLTRTRQCILNEMRWLRKCINRISNWTVITIRWTFEWRRCICFLSPRALYECRTARESDGRKITMQIEAIERKLVLCLFFCFFIMCVFGIAFAVLIFAVLNEKKKNVKNKSCTLITTTRCSAVLYRRAFEVDARVFSMSRLWCCRMHIHSPLQPRMFCWCFQRWNTDAVCNFFRFLNAQTIDCQVEERAMVKWTQWKVSKDDTKWRAKELIQKFGTPEICSHIQIHRCLSGH